MITSPTDIPHTNVSLPSSSDKTIAARSPVLINMIPQVSSNATSLSTKERHYAQLAGKLGSLANTFETTKQHLNLAAEQAFYMRKLGIAQASTFMAVLHEVDREQEASPTHDA
ncbi:uncharacterized protein UHOD_05880 [Ustilago sp. UG-2017b]|nr:uncharacterized protein UHOD_05880 [Ustilago sp. UG-2017b]